MSKDHKTQRHSSSPQAELRRPLSHQPRDLRPAPKASCDCQEGGRSQQKTLDTTRWDLVFNKEIEECFSPRRDFYSPLSSSSCKDLLTAPSHSAPIQQMGISKEKKPVKFRKSLLRH